MKQAIFTMHQYIAMVNSFSLKNIGKWGMYALYWLAYVMLFSLIQGLPARDFFTAFCNELIGLLPKIIFVAIMVEVLADRLFFKQQVASFIIAGILLLILFAFIQRLIDNYILLEYFLTSWTKEPLFSTAPFLYNIIKLQFVTAIPFSFKLFSYWANEKNKAHEIETDKTLTELQLLRNQFHPHFLFNVLNSLYSKILSKSDDSADIVLRISSMLRFSIYDVNRKSISLKEEINYLENYIELQQIRFDDKVELSFAVEGNIRDKIIEPFLLLPFIENSFKHCMNDGSGYGWITIYLEIKDDWLTAKIENSITQGVEHKHTGEDNGVGLSQVKRRLQLLYPDNHTLKIAATAESFLVLLKLKLHAGN